MRSPRMSQSNRLVTAEELERLRDDDYRYELVEGRLVRMSPVSFERGRIVIQLGSLLHRHVQHHGGGAIVSDVGFKLTSNPDTVRGPDVAFIRSDRIPAPGTRGFLKHVPDAAFEVLSPDDRPGEMGEKIAEYLDRGVPLVVVLDPHERTVSTFRPGAQTSGLRDEDVLDLSDVIPLFRCRVREIFE